MERRWALITVSCKLIRVFYAVIIKGMDYDRFKMCKISVEKATYWPSKLEILTGKRPPSMVL